MWFDFAILIIVLIMGVFYMMLLGLLSEKLKRLGLRLNALTSEVRRNGRVKRYGVRNDGD